MLQSPLHVDGIVASTALRMNDENELLVSNRLANRFEEGKNPLREAHLKHESVQSVGHKCVGYQATKTVDILVKSEPSNGHFPCEPLGLPDETRNDLRTSGHAV